MHEDGLDGVAYARALRLGVQDDVAGPVVAGGRVEEDVHDARARLDDRNRGLGDDGLDESGAAAGNEHVDESAGVHEGAGAVPTEVVDALHGLGRDPLGLQRVAHDGDEHRVGALRRGSPTQHHGVAGAQCERGDVDRDVGSRLVDRAHHAEGHRDLLQAQPIRQGALIEHAPDRVGQHGDVAHGGGQCSHALVVETKTVEQRLADGIRPPAREIVGVGSDDVVGGGDQRVGDGDQQRALLRGIEQGDLARRVFRQTQALVDGGGDDGHALSVPARSRHPRDRWRG